jgi:hypothetical protein
MQGDLECEGRVKLSPLPWETSERLAQFSGNWLEFAPGENSIVVKEPQPAGCPAFTAVPCELISLIHSIPAELRGSIPGGALYIRNDKGEVLRLVVEGAEIRLQWPQKNYSNPIPVSPESVLNQQMNARNASVNGWARFAGSCDRANELQSFVDQFGGMYPEGDIPSECEQNLVFVRFKDVKIGPKDLVEKLRLLAESPESLQAELFVSSTQAGDKWDFRVQIRDGQIWTARPSAWKES